MLLSKLAVHYYRPEFTEAQAKSMIGDMVHDLIEFPMADIEAAIKVYRQTPPPPGRVKYFPDSSVLRKLTADECKHRAAVRDDGPPKRPQFGDSRPHCWWMKPRTLWKPHWRESDVPMGEKVRDAATGKLRDPERIVA